MATSAAEYLERSVPGRHPDLPETTSGTLRLDVHEDGRTEHWYLTIDWQNVEVSRSAADADLVIRADRDVFDRLASGHRQTTAAPAWSSWAPTTLPEGYGSSCWTSPVGGGGPTHTAGSAASARRVAARLR